MLVTMSDKELNRINVIQSVVDKRMRRRDAAHQLALTERQTQRLMNRFRESGAAGWPTFGVDTLVITGFLSH
jgi:CRP-like cAMP-binding protein